MRRHHVIVLLLVLATIGAFYRAVGNDFIVYDDEPYVTRNSEVQAGLTWSTVAWAFTTRHAANWHPLTWVSHALDCQVYGLKPWGHHLTNVLLHTANVLLLFYALLSMSKSPWRSAVVALLFAVHPLRVESVAWVAERKDVLSTFFWMLTMYAYARYAERPDRARYCAVTLSLGLGLIAKPMLVTLPFVLLLMDYWPLGRTGRADRSGIIAEEGSRSAEVAPGNGGSTLRRLVMEKVPLLGLAAVSSVVTFIVQQRGGAVGTLMEVPAGVRFENALVTYVRYLGKMLWPRGLVVFYPHSSHPLPVWQVVFAVLILAAVAVFVFRVARRRYLAVGWLWYLGTLVPVIGLVQVGWQSMADRYTYVPLIGVFIMLAWGIPDLLGRPAGDVIGEGDRSGRAAVPLFSNSEIVRSFRCSILPVASTIAVLALVVSTWCQVGYWRDTLTLFGHTVRVTGSNFMVQNNIGVGLSNIGRYEEAIPHFRKVLELDPENVEANYNMGNALVKLGQLDKAAVYYAQAVRLNPAYADAHNNLGNVLSEQGNLDEAIEAYRMALRARPGDADIRRNLDTALREKKGSGNALARYRSAIRKNPRDVQALLALGVLLTKSGNLSEAIEHFTNAIQVKPSYEGHYSLANALSNAGRVEEAVEHYREAIRLAPDRVEAHYNLANVLSAEGRTDEAIAEYRQAVRVKPGFAEGHNNLAVALFDKGDYAGAWREVHLSRKSGGKPHPGFLQALSERMPDPGG